MDTGNMWMGAKQNSLKELLDEGSPTVRITVVGTPGMMSTLI